MLPRMIERAAQLGLARHVHFTGFLRGDDVERMYAMADVYVMPSVSEPFGIAPLEAMALDVPVIVSRQSGVSEVLRNALKVDFWDVQRHGQQDPRRCCGYPALRETADRAKAARRCARMRWELRGRRSARPSIEELRARDGSLVFYFQVHQPFRLRRYTFFDIGRRATTTSTTSRTRASCGASPRGATCR